jgi:hypothetical protein
MPSHCGSNRRIQNRVFRYLCPELCLSGGIRGAAWSFGSNSSTGYLFPCHLTLAPGCKLSKQWKWVDLA